MERYTSIGLLGFVPILLRRRQRNISGAAAGSFGEGIGHLT
ncbi:MAG: hypothetical protein ABSD28_18725 [Tepidisphaeraceae bacterium]